MLRKKKGIEKIPKVYSISISIKLHQFIEIKT